jgi:hypothetical protein
MMPDGIGRAQEAETVLQDLEHAVAVDGLAVARMRLEDREDDVLLARAGNALQAHRIGHLHQLVDGLGLELVEAHALARLRKLFAAYDLAVVGRIERFRIVDLVGSTAHVAVDVAAAAAAAAPIAVAMALPLVALVAVGPAEITPHRLLSRKAFNWDSDIAPTFCASTLPFLNRISVGMPRMPNLGGVCGFSSMLSFAILSLPW